MARKKNLPKFDPYAGVNDATKLLRYMALRGAVTRLHALSEFRIQGITGRITDLRNDDWLIRTERCVDEQGRSFSKWHLDEEQAKIVRIMVLRDEDVFNDQQKIAA